MGTIIKYEFGDKNDFFLFQDAFDSYLSRKNPFHFHLEPLSDFKNQQASYAIGKAHMDQFLLELERHPFTSLAEEERQLSQEVFLEMNVAILRYEIEDQFNQWSYDTSKYVMAHVSLFPCSFSHQGQCSVDLPEKYEPLLDCIIAFLSAIVAFDVEALARFLETHYMDIDPGWVRERLSFFAAYYRGRDFDSKILSIVNERREKQQ